MLRKNPNNIALVSVNDIKYTYKEYYDEICKYIKLLFL